LLEAGKLPECWIPPRHVLEIRAKVRLYKDLLEQRGGWRQRARAEDRIRGLNRHNEPDDQHTANR